MKTTHTASHPHPPQSSPATPADTYEELLDVPVVSHVVDVRAAERLPVETRPARTWTTGQVTVPPGAVVQVVNAHPARSRLSLIAVNAPAYVAPHAESCTLGMGHLLTGSTAAVHTHRGAVWATVDPAAGAPVVISYAAEFLDG